MCKADTKDPWRLYLYLKMLLQSIYKLNTKCTLSFPILYLYKYMDTISGRIWNSFYQINFKVCNYFNQK